MYNFSRSSLPTFSISPPPFLPLPLSLLPFHTYPSLLRLSLGLIVSGKDQRDHFYFIAMGHYKLEVHTYITIVCICSNVYWYTVYCTFGVHLRIASSTSGSWYAKHFHNLFHVQLKCTYVHAKRKIKYVNVRDPKIMKSHFLLKSKT